MSNIYESKNKGVQGSMTVDDIYIQDGKTYVVSTIDTVAQSTGWSFVHIKPSAEMHLFATLRTAGSGEFKLFRNPVFSSTATASTGTALNARNYKDSVLVGSGAAFSLNPELSSTGAAVREFGTTLVNEYVPGSGRKFSIGFEAGRKMKFILASSNTYGFYYSPTTDGTKMSWNLSYYQDE